MNCSKRFDEIYITFSFVIDHWINHSLYFTAEITSASCVPLADRVDGQMLKASLLFLIIAPYINIFWSPAAANEDAVKLNETLRTQDKTLEKSLPELQSEAERMVIEMRNRELSMQEKIAQDELK